MDSVNSLIDNIETFPTQLKEKILNAINQDQKHSKIYAVEENAVYMKTLWKCK